MLFILYELYKYGIHLPPTSKVKYLKAILIQCHCDICVAVRLIGAVKSAL